MRQHLNTLFITLEGAYLHKEGAAVEVRHQGQRKIRVPLHNLDGIVCFGWDTTASAALMAACSESDVALSFHNPHGKFLAATRGFASGNILLRRSQYRVADSEKDCLPIVSPIIAAKIANSRTVLQRARRDSPKLSDSLADPISELAKCGQVALAADTVDALRGIEGLAANAYFAAFPSLTTHPDFHYTNRNRRPPTDPLNALLSFLYTLLMHDCRSALESVGLDPQCGFLHRDRPGRPSLALDLMEEFRAPLADRAAFTLVNRQQLSKRDFETKENGAVYLKDDSRKKVLSHWQERKQKTIRHPFLEEETTIGLLPHLQARLLARHLRGDLDAYPAFLSR